jgi:polysaccharide export outer membrane protein
MSALSGTKSDLSTGWTGFQTGGFAPGRMAQRVLCAFLVLVLASCGLPRSGPNKAEILAVGEDQSVQAHIVPVSERVTQVIPQPPTLRFPNSFVNAGIFTPDIIRPGDTLSFTIYETIDEGLFTRGGSTGASIGDLQVDNNGSIYIPFAGRIRAAGNTPERIRQIVTERLATQTPAPEVVVRRIAGDGGTVSVVGSGIAGQGTYPLQRSNLRLMGLIATAGGVSGDPEVARVIIVRGRQRAEMWYEDVYDNPRFDVALRPGDRIIVENEQRSFTSLGATRSQGLIPFETKTLSALEAIAQVGGLSSTSADPTGIFVIRDETAKIANAVLGRSDCTTTQRVVYLLNLTEPSGLFFARNFNIQDGDTVYVTEAPFTQWTKTINAITGTAGTVQTLETLATGN